MCVKLFENAIVNGSNFLAWLGGVWSGVRMEWDGMSVYFCSVYS